MNKAKTASPTSTKLLLKGDIKQILETNHNDIKTKLTQNGYYDLFEIYLDDIVKEIFKRDNIKTEKQMIDFTIKTLTDKSMDMSNAFSKKTYNIIIKHLNDEYGVLESTYTTTHIIKEILKSVDDNIDTFVNDFIETKQKEPTINDFTIFVESHVDIIANDLIKNNKDSSNTNNEDNDDLVINDNLFKNYNINYTIDGYDEMDVALKDLRNMVNDYNMQNPLTPINMNIIDNTIHAKLNKKTIISRLKKCAANSIWELLKELNFDFQWIQNNSNNGVLTTFYEGQLNETGIEYNNIQHFIVYYDGPITAIVSRLRKVADQLLLPASEKPLLLPEPNNYYVILHDAFGSVIDKNANSIELACPGVKKFSNFVDAEKWVLSEKPQIIARDGNNVEDNGVWKKHEESIYEKYYNETGKVPSNQKTEYSITISLSDTEDARDIYNKWKEKYKDII